MIKSLLSSLTFSICSIAAFAQWQPANLAASDNGNVYHLNGNVGIGTSAPSVKLEVNGVTNHIGKVGIGNSSPTYELDINGVLPYIRLHSSDYSNNPPFLTKKAGIIFNHESSDKTSAITGAVPPGYHVPGILFSTKTAWNAPGPSGTDWYDRMFIHPNGNVGIDNMNPATRLHVNGALRIDGNVTLPVNAVANDAANYTSNFNFKLASNNNGFYIALSNVANDRKTLLQSGHESTQYAYGVGILSLNPFGGNVGIGTTNPTQKLEVKGMVYSSEVKVDLAAGTGPDYVFEKDYALPTLESVKTYIDQNKHLPEVPSAKEMEANGINLSEMNMLLLKKVEELTLYVIELKKENESQQKEINRIKTAIR